VNRRTGRCGSCRPVVDYAGCRAPSVVTVGGASGDADFIHINKTEKRKKYCVFYLVKNDEIVIFASFFKLVSMEKKHWELKKLLEAVEKEFSWKPLKPFASDKVKAYLKGVENPKQETLDKISLFVGFQSWADFKAALHGETDAESNYEDESEQKVSPK